MKPYLHPIPIASLLVALGGAAYDSIPTVILGVLVALASVGLLAARSTQEKRSEVESLSAEGRTLLKPVTKQVEAIEGIEGASKEAVNEARELSAGVTKALLARDRLKATLKGRWEAEKELGESRMRLEFAKGEEKRSLEQAIAARTAELAHYQEVEGHMKKIELSVHEAESALVELKARLAAAAAQPDTDDLRPSLARMEALTAGYAELEDELKTTG